MAYLLQHLLSEATTRQPDAEALRFPGQSLTYAALDSVSNKLAQALHSLGVAPGDRVGIYLDKSIASVVSVFGALKAGGVYVPLDANAPAKRIAFLMRDCGIEVVLTSADKMPELLEVLEEATPVKALVLTNADGMRDAAMPNGTLLLAFDEVCRYVDDPFPLPRATDTNLAYILYTSGSTGNPKGVMISHRTIMSFINWSCDTFGMTPADNVTSHAPLHFDLSTFDIFTTIKAGGTVVLVPERLSVFPVQLTRLLQDEHVTVTYLVPSILSMLANYGKPETHDLLRLRTILFAGEVFPIKQLRKLVAAIPHAKYFNLYGPTETNVCTYYHVQPHDLDPNRTQPVPIGRACENIEVFAVDDSGQIVTCPGTEGELWVRGSCVAQGYWGDPKKSESVFVPNRFQTSFTETAYRTGDIVVLDEDLTNWRYVGRRDQMIKSRGFRIELGEIEAAMNNHAKVQEAAAVAVPDDLLGNRIIAFAVPLTDASLDVQDLQQHLSKLLPHYMLPESIEIRDILPMTSSGKINRQLLASDAWALACSSQGKPSR